MSELVEDEVCDTCLFPVGNSTYRWDKEKKQSRAKRIPDIYTKLLSVAFYLILEDNNPLYRFEKWNLTARIQAL